MKVCGDWEIRGRGTVVVGRMFVCMYVCVCTLERASAYAFMCVHLILVLRMVCETHA